jgi:hypothetical protein
MSDEKTAEGKKKERHERYRQAAYSALVYIHG